MPATAELVIKWLHDAGLHADRILPASLQIYRISSTNRCVVTYVRRTSSPEDPFRAVSTEVAIPPWLTDHQSPPDEAVEEDPQGDRITQAERDQMAENIQGWLEDRRPTS